MESKKKLKRKVKRLQEVLCEEKRQRKYAERDAKMWCEVVLEQEDDLQRKDVMVADLEVESRQSKEKITELKGEYVNLDFMYEKQAKLFEDEFARNQKLEAEIAELKAPKVKAWMNGEEVEVEWKAFSIQDDK